MSEANFNLQEWISNSPKLNHQIKTDNLGLTKENECVKTLGMSWYLNENSEYHDSICTKSYNLDKDAKTKRQILSESAKVYDPLGLFSPCTILSRLLLQEIWKKQLGWDEVLPEEDQKTWRKLAKNLEQLQKIKIRRIIGHRNKAQSLHIFTDASANAYGCCAYLVGENQSALIYSKAKVTPIKPKRSIPQLELLALTIGVKVSQFLQEIISNLESIHIWSDSQVSLTWVMQTKSHSCKNVFVKNRILEIENISNALESKSNLTIQYHYVPTKQNPADHLSRAAEVLATNY
jgi:ribonuclease HI